MNLTVMSVVENHLSESGTLGATKYSGMGGDSEMQPFLLHKSKIAKQALDIYQESEGNDRLEECNDARVRRLQIFGQGVQLRNKYWFCMGMTDRPSCATNFDTTGLNPI